MNQSLFMVYIFLNNLVFICFFTYLYRVGCRPQNIMFNLNPFKMSKKEKNEEIMSRREFFKSAAKGALPILGMVLLSSKPLVLNASEAEPSGCNNSCYRGCASHCTGHCQTTCNVSCKNHCRNDCGATCKYTCSGKCTSSSKY